jgi:hypothetical protein
MSAPELTTVAPTSSERVMVFKRLQDAFCGEGAIKAEDKITFEKKGGPVEGIVRKAIESM